MQRLGLVIRIIYALCLAGATFNHVRALLAHGWLPDHLPTATAVYWSSLTVLDPVAIVLLFLRPRAGIALTAAIIASNVAHNLWFIRSHPLRASFAEDVTSSPFMLSQLAFLIFVMATARVAWRGAKAPTPTR